MSGVPYNQGNGLRDDLHARRDEALRRRRAPCSTSELCVERGEFVALLGPSGCGKTTLLRLVAGFERPDAGEIAIEDRPVFGPGVFVPAHARGIGMVFQEYALFPHLSVEQNVGFGVRARRAPRARPRAASPRRPRRSTRSRFPHELSGGQQQRVALARALAPRPSVVLLDEPWSNIDPLLRASMRDELADILRGHRRDRAASSRTTARRRSRSPTGSR